MLIDRPKSAEFLSGWYRGSNKIPDIPSEILDGDEICDEHEWEDIEQYYCDSIGLGINAEEIIPFMFISEVQQ